jgi:hypothetical protein
MYGAALKNGAGGDGKQEYFCKVPYPCPCGFIRYTHRRRHYNNPDSDLFQPSTYLKAPGCEVPCRISLQIPILDGRKNVLNLI